ncbi:MAG: permease [Gammaproteobacteria bacterium]|nr:permease [Gammaproteobacteria bacterium]
MGQHNHNSNSCDHSQGHGSKIDLLLISSSLVIAIAWLSWFIYGEGLSGHWHEFSHGVYDLINTMAIGIVIGIVFIGMLGRIPREFVIAIIGRTRGMKSIFRACLAGLLLDVCSHGILMVGAKLYERGASTGQVIAFLVSSPWNSFSLTIILWTMVGFGWVITFIIISMLIACITGYVFEILENRNVIPANANRSDLPEEFKVIEQARKHLSKVRFSLALVKSMLWQGLLESRMVMRWIFFGVVLAALIRTFISPETFQTWFGPTLAGLGMTLVVATVLEVCSEGSLPVAADLLNRANAPGNSLAFLMAGVSTDYTEIMILKEATSNWKIPLLLPVISLPQILLMGYLLNQV